MATVEQIVALQRSIGNRSVCELLRSSAGEKSNAKAQVIRRHAGNIAGQNMLATIKTSGGSPLAKALVAGPQMPASLTTIRDNILTNTTETVRTIVMAVLEPSMSLRPSMTFKNPLPAVTGPAKPREKAVRDWASGTGEYAFDIDLPGMHQFMADLFQLIAANHKDISGNLLTRADERDLFHGHVVPSESTRDLVVLFHAKEYPGTLAPEFANKNVLLPGSPQITNDVPTMTERNFLWTLSANQVFVLSDPNRMTGGRNADFDAMTAQEGKVGKHSTTTRQAGTVFESNFGQDLMNVNYFPGHLEDNDPHHQKQLFFTPVGQWGVLMKLKKTYPSIPPKDIETAYQGLDDSLVKTEKAIHMVQKGHEVGLVVRALTFSKGDQQAAELAIQNGQVT